MPPEAADRRGGGNSLAYGEKATSGCVGEDGVPRILLLPSIDEGAVKDGEESAPYGESSADMGSVEANDLCCDEEVVTLGGVMESLQKVEGRATNNSHTKTIQTRFSRCHFQNKTMCHLYISNYIFGLKENGVRVLGMNESLSLLTQRQIQGMKMLYYLLIPRNEKAKSIDLALQLTS